MKTSAIIASIALFLTACAPAADSTESQTAEAAKPPVAGAEDYATVSNAEILRLLGESKAPVLLDCRTAQEFDEGHVPTAINLSHDLLPERIGDLEPYKDEQIVIYCRSGRRARIAFQELRKAGFQKLALMPGDMIEWKEKKYPLETAPVSGGE